MNDPPPGTDEVVAMTQIVTFLEEGIVLPNGDRMVRIFYFNCFMIMHILPFLITHYFSFSVHLKLLHNHFVKWHQIGFNPNQSMLISYVIDKTCYVK